MDSSLLAIHLQQRILISIKPWLDLDVMKPVSKNVKIIVKFNTIMEPMKGMRGLLEVIFNFVVK